MKLFRNIIAVVLGLAIGGYVNMFIVMKGSLPIGVTMENLSESMHLLEAKHYFFPVLGHAVGTLIGAFITALIAISYKLRLALLIGLLFLIGGIMNIYTLNYPILPAIIDLVIAYIPMGYFGWELADFFKRYRIR